MAGLKSIEDKIKALRQFKEDAPRIAVDALEENAHIVLDMVFEEQLFLQGITGDNIPIMKFEPYSPATVFLKRQKGQPSDRVTLRDEGDFHGDGQLNRLNDLEVLIGSGDRKSADLQDRYGKEILALTDENMAELREFYVKPFLLTKAREKL